MLDPSSRLMAPRIARAIEGLEQVADLLVAIHESRMFPGQIPALVLEALTCIEASKLSLSLDAIDDDLPRMPLPKPASLQ